MMAMMIVTMMVMVMMRKLLILFVPTVAFFMPSIMDDLRATLETHMK
jgi:hypothetical protein